MFRVGSLIHLPVAARSDVLVRVSRAIATSRATSRTVNKCASVCLSVRVEVVVTLSAVSSELCRVSCECARVAA